MVTVHGGGEKEEQKAIEDFVDLDSDTKCHIKQNILQFAIWWYITLTMKRLF
jgi:hypothetical protein